MVDLFNYFRRETTEVNIGAVPLGGPNSNSCPVDDQYVYAGHAGLCGTGETYC